MLKSTYKPSANLVVAQASPLPPGWTEHKAPTGHTYYYNSETKESTYKRPGAPDIPTAAVPPPVNLPAAAPQYPHAYPNLSDPRVANAFLASQNRQNQPPPSERPNRDRDPQQRPKPQPLDKPRSKEPIPGCEPWILVYTKYGRRFVYNSAKKASYWRIPEKLKPAILELDKARVREKAEQAAKAAQAEAGDGKDGTSDKPVGPAERPRAPREEQAVDESSEYEEVEVTDDEGEEDEEAGDGGHRAKRQRTEEQADEDMLDPETEMMLQLQMMEQGEGQDEAGEVELQDWAEDDETAAVSEEDARELFKDMLNDFRISPYSPWEKLLEEGKVFDDPRYTILTTTKARKEVWEEWSREKIKKLKELRAKEEKKDPKVAYMAFLEQNATPKLYWPEFKRKFRKEPCMKDFAVSDRDREKWYREYISRLKLPQSTLKSDLAALLKSQPLSVLNNATSLSNLPPQLRADTRYMALRPEARDPLVEAYIQTLGPPPDAATAEDDAAAAKAKAARQKRELALEERNRAIEEQKKQELKEREIAKARLRQGEREIEQAMRVSKRGLQSQLE